MSRVMPITAALAAAMLATASGALAQVTSDQKSDNSPGTSAADSAYIRQAIRSNFTEVALGRLAESRASDSAVEEFAERVISEHNSMNAQWGALARNNGMRVGLDLDPAGQQAIERLEDLDGAEFDQGYMAEVIRQHEQDLAAFQGMGTSARSPEVRQLANSGVATIRQHLDLAQEVGSRVGVSTTAGRARSVTTRVPTPSGDARRRTTDDRDTRDERDARNNRDDRPPLRGEDRVFVEGVLSDHLMHIRLAKRAKREARSDEVRQLAERMEKEFTEWAERWENFADRRGANVTSHLERQHREKLERLEKASERKDFDRAYAAIVAEHLEWMVHELREERREERPAAVGRLAEQELPLLRELLARARRLERQASERKKASDGK